MLSGLEETLILDPLAKLSFLRYVTQDLSHFVGYGEEEKGEAKLRDLSIHSIEIVFGISEHGVEFVDCLGAYTLQLSFRVWKHGQ